MRPISPRREQPASRRPSRRDRVAPDRSRRAPRSGRGRTPPLEQQREHVEPVGRPHVASRALAGDARARRSRASTSPPRASRSSATLSASLRAPGRSSPFAGSPGSPITSARSLSPGRRGRQRRGAVLWCGAGARAARCTAERHLGPPSLPDPARASPSGRRAIERSTSKTNGPERRTSRNSVGTSSR